MIVSISRKEHKPKEWQGRQQGGIDPSGSKGRVKLILKKGELKSTQTSIIEASYLSLSSFIKTLLVTKLHDP